MYKLAEKIESDNKTIIAKIENTLGIKIKAQKLGMFTEYKMPLRYYSKSDLQIIARRLIAVGFKTESEKAFFLDSIFMVYNDVYFSIKINGEINFT